MSKDISKEQQSLYANKLFLGAVLPLLKTIVEDREKFQKKWKDREEVCQVSCQTDEGKDGIHFLFSNGSCTPVLGLYEEGKCTADLEFSSREHLNAFFKNQTKKMPKLNGFLSHPGAVIRFLMLLMFMGNLLGNAEAPESEEDQQLLVKSMFHLLSRGISILNKLGHPEVCAWTENSPDRVYAWEVEGHPELSAHLRVKKGKTRARRGRYTKSMPFFTMKFDSPVSALGILQSNDDMIESTISKKLIMIGGPEFGAQIGDHMMLVGSYIQ